MKQVPQQLLALVCVALTLMLASCGSKAPQENPAQRITAMQETARGHTAALATSVLQGEAGQQDRSASKDDFLAELNAMRAALQTLKNAESTGHPAEAVQAIPVPSAVPPLQTLVSDFGLGSQWPPMVTTDSLSRVLSSAIQHKEQGDPSGVNAVLEWCDAYVSLVLRTVRLEFAQLWIEALIQEISGPLAFGGEEPMFVIPDAVASSDVLASLRLNLIWWCKEVDEMFLAPRMLDYAFEESADDIQPEGPTRVEVLERSVEAIAAAARHWNEHAEGPDFASQSWVELTQVAEAAATSHPAPFLFEADHVRNLRQHLFTYCIVRAILLDDTDSEDHKFKVSFNEGQGNQATIQPQHNATPEAAITIPWPPR
jgi:hypothetical protein